MLTENQIIRLRDIGFAACHTGAVPQGRKIFDGLLVLRPGDTGALIGKALSHIVVGEFPAAEEILQTQVLAKLPDDPEGLTMLGLCYALNGKYDDARAVLGKVKDLKTESGQLARNLLAGLG